MNKSVKEMVKKWDEGASFWSIEMGGIGPGYEQAIQIAVIEICRGGLEHPEYLKPKNEKYSEEFNKMVDEIVHKHNDSCGGFSGAQVGAAKQLAYKFLTIGPEKVAKEINDSRRHIQVDKLMPSLADTIKRKD